MPAATKPTSKQLSYLRQLANRTGQTFTCPRSRAEASREIDRLKRAKHRHGGRPLTADEFDELIAPHVGPADGEG